MTEEKKPYAQIVLVNGEKIPITVEQADDIFASANWDITETEGFGDYEWILIENTNGNYKFRNIYAKNILYVEFGEKLEEENQPQENSEPKVKEKWF